MSLNVSLKASLCCRITDVHTEGLGPQLKGGKLQMQNTFSLGYYYLDIYSKI